MSKIPTGRLATNGLDVMLTIDSLPSAPKVSQQIGASSLFMMTSSNGTTANSSPQSLLYNSYASDVSSDVRDIIDARSIWDGSNWQAYMHAAGWSGEKGSTWLNNPSQTGFAGLFALSATVRAHLGTMAAKLCDYRPHFAFGIKFYQFRRRKGEGRLTFNSCSHAIKSVRTSILSLGAIGLFIAEDV